MLCRCLNTQNLVLVTSENVLRLTCALGLFIKSVYEIQYDYIWKIGYSKNLHIFRIGLEFRSFCFRVSKYLRYPITKKKVMFCEHFSRVVPKIFIRIRKILAYSDIRLSNFYVFECANSLLFCQYKSIGDKLTNINKKGT